MKNSYYPFIFFTTIAILAGSACSVSKKATGPKNGVYERWAVEYSILGNKADTIFTYSVSFKNDTLDGPCVMSASQPGKSSMNFEYAEEINGRPGTLKGNYGKGLKGGAWIHWDLSGKITQLEEYSWGVRDGKCICFGERPEDTLSMETYKLGIKHGRSFQRGDLGFDEWNYNNGNLHGNQMISRDGKYALLETALFDNGALLRFSTTDTLGVPEIHLDETGSGTIIIRKLSLSFHVLSKLKGSGEEHFFFNQYTDDVVSGVLHLSNGFLDGRIRLKSELGNCEYLYEFINGCLRAE